MSHSRRISVKPVTIDYAATQSFFEARGRRDYANQLSATMYQDQEPALVEARDQAEKVAIESLLDLTRVSRVLDIGCGIGRWGWFLKERSPQVRYLGIDFSSSLVEKARQEAERRCVSDLNFQVMSATSIEESELVVSSPFDILLISGLLIYLNDEDCIKVLRDTARFCVSGGAIYLREPVGVSERFTLDRFYSKELGDEYSAIYRTVEELYSLMDQAFEGMDMVVEKEGFLFPDYLEKRVETRQFFFVLRRNGAPV